LTKFVLKVTLLVAFSITSLGCSPLFISENKPKTIQENVHPFNIELNNSPLSNIKGFENITQGVISDISDNGQSILLFRQDAQDESANLDIDSFNSISFYNLKDHTIKHIISPQVNVELGNFDENENGVFYLENSSESNFHLYWIDDSGGKKLRISSSDHQVNPNYHVLPNNEVYYGTKDGKIIHANKDRILSTIDLGSKYNIQQVYYYRNESLVLFTANRDGNLNLYSIKPNGEDLTLILPNVIGHFKVSPREDKMTYLTPVNDSNKRKLWLFDLEKMENNNLMEGYPNLQIFSPKGDKIAYLDKTESSSDLYNIWVLDLESNERKQVASNLKLISELFWHPRENCLYFSTYERTNSEIQAMLYSLNFEMK